ncbi:MAG TPA: hypothetical protein PKA88_21745 [Polyangiaceae bacterium]|nr:hypothetical protein [Polyangiaceae bacterium]
MPIQYAGISAEHEAVRTRVGLFDVSHMGELELSANTPLRSSTTWSPTTWTASTSVRPCTPAAATSGAPSWTT